MSVDYRSLITKLEGRGTPLDIEAARALRTLYKEAGEFEIYGRLIVYFDSRGIEIDGRPIKLGRRELSIIQTLAKKRRWVGTESFLLSIWEGDAEPNILRVIVHNLRKKLKKYLGYDCIESKQGPGYRLLECCEGGAAA